MFLNNYLSSDMIYPYPFAMRVLALMAFLALQLSVFTCGFDIHVHAMDSGVSHIAEHSHDKNGKHNPDSASHSCHLHASHSFAVPNVEQHEHAPRVSTSYHYMLADLNLKKLSFLIEHPPKLQHS